MLTDLEDHKRVIKTNEQKISNVFGSVGGDANFGVPDGGLGGRVCGFPTSFVCALQWVAVVAVSRAWRAWSLGVFVSWWHGWRWTRWQWSSPYGGRLQASRGAVLLVIFGAFGCACVVKAEGACLWCGLHRCRNGALVVLVEVLPGPACVASAVLLAAVISLKFFVVWSFGLCILVKVLLRITLLSLLEKVLPRSALCSFRATVVLPLWFEVCRLVELRSG
ncbi:hypothetical protein Taro_016242 [Colocasia esculenta]|uniref:Transmembrane protein n=1 Tax=Colocasia esculenta TaxID=4460 RepID=A0A843UJR7_COLES|nr:hypothetical protein [Colocasia esculenta]